MRDDMDGRSRQAFFSTLGSAAVRFALLFSTAGIALALFLAPVMDRETRIMTVRNYPADIDRMATGSVAKPVDYTLRRSVLSSQPGGVCVIQADGDAVGDC